MPAARPAVTTTTTEALRPVIQLSEYIPVKHAAPKADCIDLYLIALTQLHTPNRTMYGNTATSIGTRLAAQDGHLN